MWPGEGGMGPRIREDKKYGGRGMGSGPEAGMTEVVPASARTFALLPKQLAKAVYGDSCRS